MRRKVFLAFILLALFSFMAFFTGCKKGISRDQKNAIKSWIEEFQPCAISKEEQQKELEWFAETAAPFAGMEIKSVAEDINTHFWERDVLSKAFYEITGIKVTHTIIGEGEIVATILEQIDTNRKIYDIYVNDADLIGTHLRLDSALNFTDFMANEGRDVTNPYLDLDDFLNPEFGQDYDGNQLQIPDQQFTNIYWFRYDWFTREDIKKEFKEKYGYELGVPINWKAYEDIAEFFTGKEIDGMKVYGHMDYGLKSASLGWRFTDAWLSMAGVGDKGLPNGLPVDEWGIRVENKIPVGASIERGGAVNGPAAVYALTKYIEWLKKYAPPEALQLEWSTAGTVPGRGDIAQRIFQYTGWLSDEMFVSPNSKVTDANGKPLWRVAPSPHGRYWEDGMKVGYQDAGSWTILQNSVTGDYRKAAWLWAQFCISKSVCLKKFMEGRTPIRTSTVNSDYLARIEDDFGGLVTFYKSTAIKLWTDTGPNVPHYPILTNFWWENIATAISGETTPKESLDNLAEAMDNAMAEMRLVKYSPRLNPKRDPQYWLDQPGAPKPEITTPQQPKTMDYEELIKMWKYTRREFF